MINIYDSAGNIVCSKSSHIKILTIADDTFQNVADLSMLSELECLIIDNWMIKLPTTMPKLPNSLRILKCPAECRINNLPAGLEILDCCPSTNITNSHILPPKLKRLYIHGAIDLTYLPASLEFLYIYDNHNTMKPLIYDYMPVNMEYLYLHVFKVKLNKYLPAGLERLYGISQAKVKKIKGFKPLNINIYYDNMDDSIIELMKY